MPEDGDWPHYIGRPAEPLPDLDYESLVMELKDGEYAHYINSNSSLRFVSSEFKAVLEEYNPDPSMIEFIPVKVKSKEFGDKTYYIIHFTRLCMVNDEELTTYVAPPDRYPWRLVLDYDKVKDMSVFMTDARLMIVNDEIRRALNRKKLTIGISLNPVGCSHVPEELQSKGYACYK